MREEDKFVASVDGVKKTYYKLIIFESDVTKKSYIIYTDNTYKNNILNIYSSILKVDEGIELEKIEDEKDRNEVNKAMAKIKAQLQAIKDE